MKYFIESSVHTERIYLTDNWFWEKTKHTVSSPFQQNSVNQTQNSLHKRQKHKVKMLMIAKQNPLIWIKPDSITGTRTT